MLSAEQKEFRKSHWMASDTARALTGLFGGLYAVVAEKLYGIENEGNEATEIGEALEGPIREWLRNKFNHMLPGPVRAIHKTDELLAAHLDCALRIILNCGTNIPVEIKTAGFASDYTDLDAWGEDGSDQIPDYPLFQVQHQMICCDAPYGYVASWIRGRGKLLYRIERNDALCQTIREFAHYVWDTYIVPGVLPEPTEETAPLALRAMQQIERTPGKQIATTPALRNACTFYEKVRAARLAAEKVEEHTKAMILHHMGDADTADLGDELLTLKRIDNAGYVKTIEPYSYTRIDIKPKRKELTNGRTRKQLTSEG